MKKIHSLFATVALLALAITTTSLPQVVAAPIDHGTQVEYLQSPSVAVDQAIIKIDAPTFVITATPVVDETLVQTSETISDTGSHLAVAQHSNFQQAESNRMHWRCLPVLSSTRSKYSSNSVNSTGSNPCGFRSTERGIWYLFGLRDLS